MSGKRKPIMPVSELRELLGYNAETGDVFWVVPPRYGIEPGKPIRLKNSAGYIQVCLQRRPYLGHRVAWALTSGEWPVGMVDHINGARSDNRICNLRVATGAQNQANRAARKDSKSGLRGVRFDPKTGKYAAQISVGGFDTPAEAFAEFIRLSRFCYGEFAPERIAPMSYNIDRSGDP